MVKISFSATPVHMGRRCLRQKSLLQVAHVLPPLGVLAERAMMVLLVLQVHLQKEGGAGES